MADEIIIKNLESRIKKLEENCRSERITKEDDEITVFAIDCLSNRYSLYVKPDDPVQTILDKYKLELIKNTKWPVKETEYKYILRINGKSENIDDLSKIITDVGVSDESTVNISIQKNNINDELLMKINELEKCCNEFKIFEIGEILKKDNYSSQTPNFKYSKFLKGNVAENRLLYILENDFENFLKLLEIKSIFYVDRSSLLLNGNFQDMLSLLLELFRKNSELTKPISHEKFEKLIRLFIREKIFFRLEGTGESIYFDDPEFITKYYKMIKIKSPTKAINTKDENKFIEIIQLSRIPPPPFPPQLSLPPPPPFPPRELSKSSSPLILQWRRTDGKKTQNKSLKKSKRRVRKSKRAKKKSLRKKSLKKLKKQYRDLP